MAYKECPPPDVVVPVPWKTHRAVAATAIDPATMHPTATMPTMVAILFDSTLRSKKTSRKFLRSITTTRWNYLETPSRQVWQVRSC